MWSLPFFTKKDFKIKPNVLVVLDGFGIAPPSGGNPITLAKKPNLDKYFSTYPNTELIASGESVGLPTSEVGNTEVGHLTLGAGRTIFQDLKRINYAIEKGTFYDNKALVAVSNHVKSHNSRLHILGLTSSGNVHASLEHVFALLQFCKKEQLSRVFLHLFTDGRDAPPKEGIETIEKIEEHLSLLKLGQVASISGRFYAMDRDKRWPRTEKAYKAIVLGEAIQTQSARDAVNSAYARGQTDEFIEPTVIADTNGAIGKVMDNDGVIFANYRIDRPRQLAMAFTLPDFESLKKFDFGDADKHSASSNDSKVGTTFVRGKVPTNMFVVTMTEYVKGLPVSGVAYGPEIVDRPFGMVLSDNGLSQMHMSESEKERFVTYYFNGLRDASFPNEEVNIVPSPKVETYDKRPEMSAEKLCSEFLRELRRDKFHFIVINFANCDMVAHSGNLPATVKAIEVVDKQMGRLFEAVLAQNGTVFLTADHGNAEDLITFPSTAYFFTTNKGTINTDHSSNPVPFLIVNKEFEAKKPNLMKGTLADVAPTILAHMGVTIPEVMTGRNLLTVGK